MSTDDDASYEAAHDEICDLVGALHGVSPARITVGFSSEDCERGWDFQGFDVRIDDSDQPSPFYLERRKPPALDDGPDSDAWNRLEKKMIQKVLETVRKRCRAVVRAVARRAK